MMRTVTQNRFIQADTWIHYLAKEFEKRNIEALIHDGDDFFALPIFRKVQILLFLCEWQFEEPDRIRNVLRDEEDEASEWVHQITLQLFLLFPNSSCANNSELIQSARMPMVIHIGCLMVCYSCCRWDGFFFFQVVEFCNI